MFEKVYFYFKNEKSSGNASDSSETEGEGEEENLSVPENQKSDDKVDVQQEEVNNTKLHKPKSNNKLRKI